MTSKLTLRDESFDLEGILSKIQESTYMEDSTQRLLGFLAGVVSTQDHEVHCRQLIRSGVLQEDLDSFHSFVSTPSGAHLKIAFQKVSFLCNQVQLLKNFPDIDPVHFALLFDHAQRGSFSNLFEEDI